MTLPQTNATITHVAGEPDGGEAFEGPEARGAAKFDGAASAYLRERRDRQRSGEGEDIVLDRLLIVENGEPAIAWSVGDFVDFEHGGDALTGRVQLVERRDVDDPDIPSEFQTTRLTLTLR